MTKYIKSESTNVRGVCPWKTDIELQQNYLLRWMSRITTIKTTVDPPTGAKINSQGNPLWKLNIHVNEV